MDIPIEILYMFIGIAMALPILGFFARFSIPPSLFLFVSGGLLLALFVMTDNIIMEFKDSTTITHNKVLLAQQTSQSLIGQHSSATGVMRSGEFLNSSSSLIGMKINTIELDLKRTGCGACGGYMTIGIQSNTAGTFTKSFDTITPAQLTTSFTMYNFSLPDNQLYTLVANDRIAFDIGQATGTGAGNSLDLGYHSQSFNGQASRMQIAGNPSPTVWTNLGDNDLTFRLFGIEDGISITEQPVLFEFTEEIKVFMMLFAVVMLLAGGVTELDARRK